MQCCEYGPWYRIRKTLFSLQLENWTNKLECLKLESLSSMMLCNILAYWANL